MRKKGFTLLEVVLAVTLFGLMIGVILQAYTSIQLGNVKTIDTQKTIEVSENFFERLNDMATDYVIDTGKYGESDYVIKNGNLNIINSGVLRLKSTIDDTSVVFKTGCTGGMDSLCIQSNSTGKKCNIYNKGCIPSSEDGPINLSKYDEVSVDDLNFEIYPDQQYVNINIKTSISGGETLQSGDGIRLTTTVGFKTYDKYEGELTAETLCEDVCSISQISNTGMKQSTINMANNGNNITNDACTLGVYKSNNNSIIFGILDGWFNIYGNHNYDHQDIYTIASGCNSRETTRCRSHCNKNKPGNNPYNCGYIRNTIKSGAYTSFSSSGHDGQSGCQIYNEYVMNFACQSMCEASIFSCIDDYEDPLVKRTGIKINTGEHAGEYLQNPKLYELSDSDNYNTGIWSGEFGRKCDTGTLIRKNNSTNILEGFFLLMVGGLEYYWTCNKTGIIYCDGTYYGNSNNESAIYISEDEYKYDCVKWTWKSISSTSNKSGTRYVYSTEPKNVGTSCVCDVDYTYSLNAGGFIESGSCGGLKTIRGEGFGTGYEELDYIAKNADLIYYANGTGFASGKRSNIKNDTGLKSRVGINSVILDTNCEKYENGVCSIAANFNDKTYKVAGESGMYQDTFTNRSTCGCSNSEYYDCVGNCTCENGAKQTTIYLTGHDVSPAKRRYCLHIIAEDSGYNKGSKHKVDWSGSFEHGDCLVNSGEGCIGGQHTGYNYINFSDMELNSEGLRRRYCGTNDRSGGGYLNGREGMVGNHDSDLTNGENSRYSGYEYFCKKKTDECRNESNITISSSSITPKSYCEDILSGVVGTYEFNTDDFGLGILLEQRSYTENLSGCLYSFSGVKKTIDNNTANDWYCKQTGYDLGWNGSNCEKCTLSGNEKQIKSGDANDWYCKKLGELWESDGNSCRKQVNENIIKKYYCENYYTKSDTIEYYRNNNCYKRTYSSRKTTNNNTEQKCNNNGNYRYNNKCYGNKTETTQTFQIKPTAYDYYYNNHPDDTFNLSIVTDLNKQYCESLGNKWSSTYNLCYSESDNCLKTTTQTIDQTGAKQQYCINSGYNRNNVYGCRTTGDGTFSGIIPLNYFEKSVIYRRFLLVPLYDTYHFDGIDNLYLNNLSDSDKKLICNKVLNKPWLNSENFYDPFEFRRNKSPKIYNYERKDENKECKYCDLYRNAYTGVYGYELGYNQDTTDHKLQELWCKRKHNQDHTYQRDGTGCYTGIFITCDETGIVYNKIDLTGDDEFYEEAYCNSGVSNGRWTSMGATNSGSSRSGNICLDTSNGYTTCIHGTNITGTNLYPKLPYYTSYQKLDNEMSRKSSEGIGITINEKQLKVKNTGYVFYIGEDSDWLNCLGGKLMTNVYKNYNHTCEMSITQQSNNILNIIDSISKNRRTSTVDYSDVPRYLRWTIR